MENTSAAVVLEGAYAENPWDGGLRAKLEAALLAEGLDQEAVDERVFGIHSGDVEPRQPALADLDAAEATPEAVAAAPSVEL